MEKFAIVVIILLSLVIVALVVYLNKDKLKKLVPKADVKMPPIDINIRPPKIKQSLKLSKKSYRGTVEDSKGFIEMIDDNGNVIKAYELVNITPLGSCINRAGAKHRNNQITIDNVDKANTISSDAYYLYYDNNDECLILAYHDKIEKSGYQYINSETGRPINRMYYYDYDTNSSVPSECFKVVNGCLFCLGKQWFRYVETPLPSLNNAQAVFNRAGSHTAPNVPPVAPKAPSSFSRKPAIPTVENEKYPPKSNF